MKEEENFSAIVAFRAQPSVKEFLKATARRRGQSITEFIWNLIEAGWEEVVTHPPKRKAGAPGENPLSSKNSGNNR